MEETVIIKKQKRDDSSDQLSNLPDFLLLEILSLLKAREVAQTCILSKRWLKIWSFVPSLCFDIADFLHIDDAGKVNDNNLAKFRNFVTSFLLHRNEAADIHTFRLLCNIRELEHKEEFDSEETAASAREWVLYASKRNPKILEVSFSGLYSLNLPDCFFTSETLEDLNLRFFSSNMNNMEAQRVCLPRLRSFNLEFACFFDDYLNTYLSGCPALESLSMDYCTYNDFSSDTVKRLQLTGFPMDVTICASALEIVYFNLDDFEKMIILKNASKLTHATFLTDDFYSEREYRCNLLSSLSSVEHLRIDSGYFMRMLEAELPKCPTFFSLKNLTLGGFCMRCAFDAVCSFLDHCPMLEELTLMHTESEYLCLMGGDHSAEEFDEELGQIKEFSCKGLKIVKIMYREWEYTVHELVGLILQRTMKIKGIQILLTMHDGHRFEDCLADEDEEDQED